MFLHISQFEKSKNNIVSQFQSESVYVKHLKEEHNCTPEDLEEAEVNIKSCFVLFHILHCALSTPARTIVMIDVTDKQRIQVSDYMHMIVVSHGGGGQFCFAPV